MLVDRIREEIADRGPMPFNRFMEIALYDPDGGFFGSGRLRSHKTGDFLTSPEVSPLFGATLGSFVEAERKRLGDPLAVVDCGAGSGSLLTALLGEVEGARGYAVEVSPAAREKLAESLTVLSSLDEVPGGGNGVVIANELVDNLPFAIAVRRGSGWAEEVVVAGGSAGLATAEVDPRQEVASWAERYGRDVPEGGRVEVQLAAGEWLTNALRLFDAGVVVVVDYGDSSEGLQTRRAVGTMRTYRAHHLGPDPLLEPGATDITSDVDFTALEDVARSSGAGVEVNTQAGFLRSWGLGETLQALRKEELEAARDGDTMERLRLRSLVTGAEALLHPRGLGDFRVLVAKV